MDFKELCNLSYDNETDLINHIKKLAIQNGFKLYCKDSLSSSRIRSFCSQHQIHKGIKNSH